MYNSQQFGCVSAVTGPVDVVTDGMRLMRVANGHPMMATVTGTGCMATSVVAACADVERDSITAATAALAAYGLAGQIASQRAQGPGTFQIYLYDALAGLTDDVLRAGSTHRRVAPANNRRSADKTEAVESSER